MRLQAVVALVALVGCSAIPGVGGPRRPNPGSGSSMNAAEFRRAEFKTMHEAVRTLRPHWFQPVGGVRRMGNNNSPMVGVFIQGHPAGYAIQRLQELTPQEVWSARRLLPSESMASFGTQWAWGGILLVLAR